MTASTNPNRVVTTAGSAKRRKAVAVPAKSLVHARGQKTTPASVPPATKKRVTAGQAASKPTRRKDVPAASPSSIKTLGYTAVQGVASWMSRDVDKALKSKNWIGAALKMASALRRTHEFYTDPAKVESAIADRLFFARHPERIERHPDRLFGDVYKPFKRGEPDFAKLSREWTDLRDFAARPALGAAWSDGADYGLRLVKTNPLNGAKLSDAEIAHIAMAAGAWANRSWVIQQKGTPLEHCPSPLAPMHGHLGAADVFSRLKKLQAGVKGATDDRKDSMCHRPIRVEDQVGHVIAEAHKL